MHRPARLLLVASSLAAALLGHAGAAESAPPAPPSATTPPGPASLRGGLDALRTTDYARAERELAAVRGADQPAAQVALARVMLETGRMAEADRIALQVAGAGSASSQKLAAVALRAEVLSANGKVSDAVKLLETQKDAAGPGGRRVRLLLGEYRIAAGRRADADEPLMKIIEEYNSSAIASSDAEGLAVVARAAYLLRSPKDANSAFNESERVDKQRLETMQWRAELFLDKYDPGHAEELLREALDVAPRRADLLLLMARVKLDQTLDFDAAEKLVKEALAVNPRLAAAYAVRAGLALRDMDLPASDAAITAGLAIRPGDLELLSLRAATRFLADDRPGFEAAKKDTLARNPEYARMFAIIGEFAEWEHRYDDIVAMMKEATQLDPEDGKAWAELGLTQLRAGDEPAGLESLRRAWSKDHFNVRVFNTLNLYEQTIANQYETEPSGPAFRIRVPKDERKVLDRYLPRMLNEAWASMKSRYGFAPATPVQVELYGSREQFSVRTSGLPNIGIQGVCFGKVLAALSPKSEPFNWGNVVWHELGHVYAIQLSRNHVPRWFTEGLSEYETIARRPEWQRELDPELYGALTAGSLPGAVDMNRAFTHATNGLDVTVAYYAASQMLVYTVEQFGMPKVVQALKLWGEGVRTPDVLQRAFGVSPSEYDARYRAWQMGKLARYKGQFIFADHPKALEESKAAVLAAPGDASAHVGLALSLLRLRKGKEAEAEIDTALTLDPANMSAHYLASKIAKGDPAAQGTHLEAIRKAGGDGYAVQMGLADVAEAKKDRPATRAALESAARFDPTQSEPLKGLVDMAIEDKRDPDALEALKKLAVLEQHDRKIWRMLLDRLVAAKKWDDVKRFGESAMFVDVESAAVHVAYARGLAATGVHDKALYELESALLCNAAPKDLAAAHALMAAEYVALKNPIEARRHLDEALKLDPASADAKAVRVP